MSQPSPNAALTIPAAPVRLPGEVLAVARQVMAIVRRIIADPAYRVFLFGRTVDIVDFSRLARGIRESAAAHVLELGVL